MTKGFTMIEVLISVFVLGVVVVGLFGFITLVLKSTHDGQRRIVATALANEKMETIRNLSYDRVGTFGGIPSGPIVQSEDVTRNASTYTVNTDIRYIDDTFDGTSPMDSINSDYKQARVEVSWDNNLSNRSVLLITQIVPNGLEGGSSLGTLVFSALNAAGEGVAGATFRISNTTVSPVVDFTTSTNNEGIITIPGLLPSVGTYEISVTKNGYTTEQTYDQTGSFIPNVDHSHVSSVLGNTTNKTFYIDTVSSLTIKTENDVSAALGNIAYRITGSKKIGLDGTGADVYLLDDTTTTDNAGVSVYNDMTWDTYAFSVNGSVTGYDIKETSNVLPLSIDPGTDTTLTVTLVPHSPLSLHVTVLTSAGVFVPNASVQVMGPGYNQTQLSSVNGQVFFTPIPVAADYTITVTAGGFGQVVQPVTVDAGERVQVNLTQV